MGKKVLGKIEKVKFGRVHDRPYLFGLSLCLSTSNGSGVIHTNIVNIQHKGIINHKERESNIIEMNEYIYNLLKEAKVMTIDELVGKPVEMTFKESYFNILESVRILQL